jgi:predicted flap endonuclease-1-like 5' DNA nuclease
MIADLLRKGFAWARDFFWVAESSTDRARTAKQQGSSKAAAGEAKAPRAGDSTSGSRSTGERRPAAAKTSTNKRGTGAAKRTTSQSGGAAAKTAKPKSAPSKGTASKGTASKSTAPKSTGPGAAEADPAKPGDLSEIKGIGPAIKTKLAELGIKTFADLAGADAVQLSKQLNQRTITPERVRSWIAEAKKRS